MNSYIDEVLGLLSPTQGPGNIFLWKGSLNVSFNIMLENTADLHIVDIHFIREAAGNAPSYVNKAIEFVRRDMLLRPEFYGITAEQAAEYMELDLLGAPEFNFYEDKEWYIKFAEGIFPICDPYGLIVLFHGVAPVGVEDMSDN